MAYSSIVKPTDYFNTVLWTGDNTARTISGVGFQPDWIWWKQRNGTDSHRLADAVRGEGSASYKLLFSEDTSAEYDGSDNGGSQGNINAITSDGFSGVQGTSGYNNWNGSSYNYVAWNWKGNGAGSSNSDGDITSTVSANTTAGFSIVKYTGNGNSSATFGHGLGVKPKIGLLKPTSTTGNWNWWQDTTGNNSADVRVHLHLTDANNSNYPITFNTTTITLPSLADASWNGSGTEFIFYCFAEKKGYSKFGSYTGNGSTDGTFVHTGFRPAWIVVKRTDSSTGGSWILYDTKRNPHNVSDIVLAPNTNHSESDWGNVYDLDILSNGFKWKHDGSSNYVNVSGASYIYMAFAEHPFVANDSGTAVPVVAR